MALFFPASEPNQIERKGGKRGSEGFKSYLDKSRQAYSITPSTKYYMQTRSGSATNKLMRSRTLANYGLNIGRDNPGRKKYGSW